MRLVPLAVFGCLLLAGCKGNPALHAAPTVEVPSDPAEKLREQIRSASVQLSAAKESLQTAAKAAEDVAKLAGAPKELKDGMQDVEDSVNEASADIDAYMTEPKALEEFRKDLKTQEALRVKALADCNDGLLALDDAQGIAGSLSESAPGKFENPLEEVEGNLDEASDAIKGAIEALGGKVEKP